MVHEPYFFIYFLIVCHIFYCFYVIMINKVGSYMQVIENGNPIERKKWFPDIEPLFKLLSYENVPPFLKVWAATKLH